MKNKKPGVTAVIVAAGESRRFKKGENKLLALLNKKPVLLYSLNAFQNSGLIGDIVLVVNKEIKKEAEHIVKKHHIKKVKNVVIGGKQRQDSVFNGLKSVNKASDIVSIHDAARPFLTREIIERSIECADKYDAAVVSVKVKDTVKLTLNDIVVVNTLNREKLWLAQTPQVFNYKLIMKAYEKAYKESFYATDDACLVERMSYPVHIVSGSYANIKITTAEDLVLAEGIAKALGL